MPYLDDQMLLNLEINNSEGVKAPLFPIIESPTNELIDEQEYIQVLYA